MDIASLACEDMRRLRSVHSTLGLRRWTMTDFKGTCDQEKVHIDSR